MKFVSEYFLFVISNEWSGEWMCLRKKHATQFTKHANNERKQMHNERCQVYDDEKQRKKTTNKEENLKKELAVVACVRNKYNRALAQNLSY